MLILASASPRRRELLAQLGVEFRITAAGINELRLSGETAEAMTVRLAVAKARAVFARAGGVVLAGDTAVVIDGEPLGKPRDCAEARAMLQRLSGRAHTVLSAVAVAAGGQCAHRLSATEVIFDALPRRWIDAYCAGDAPYDKAGGYGIQGAAAAFVRRIKGSYSGVVGLPLWETAQLLRAAGVLDDAPNDAPDDGINGGGGGVAAV